MKTKEILNLKINNPDFDENLTVKGYLKNLLFQVWKEGESFSGKRPFGNSGWEYDLYEPLVKAGVVDGSIDEDGDIEDIDLIQANRVVLKLIDHCFC